jgi:hypothetical protein
MPDRNWPKFAGLEDWSKLTIPARIHDVFIILSRWLLSQPSQGNEQKPNRCHDGSRSQEIKPLCGMVDGINGKVNDAAQTDPKVARDIPNAR